MTGQDLNRTTWKLISGAAWFILSCQAPKETYQRTSWRLGQKALPESIASRTFSKRTNVQVGDEFIEFFEQKWGLRLFIEVFRKQFQTRKSKNCSTQISSLHSLIQVLPNFT